MHVHIYCTMLHIYQFNIKSKESEFNKKLRSRVALTKKRSWISIHSSIKTFSTKFSMYNLYVELCMMLYL